MPDPSSSPTELAPSASPWHATVAHPAPPSWGSYVPVDQSSLLSAAAPGLIPPVLVLPRAEEADWGAVGPDASTARS